MQVLDRIKNSMSRFPIHILPSRQNVLKNVHRIQEQEVKCRQHTRPAPKFQSADLVEGFPSYEYNSSYHRTKTSNYFSQTCWFNSIASDCTMM